MKFFIYLLLLCVMGTNCSSPPQKVNKTDFTTSPARILAKPYLNFRENPDVNSKIIDSIPEGYIVYALDRTNEKVTISNFESYWYKAKFKNKTGWLFGKYLDFEDKEVSISRMVQSSSKKPEYPIDFLKLRKYFEDNMIEESYEEIRNSFGKPTTEYKYKVSNAHGGFNRFLELNYNDIKFKFVDRILFEVTFFDSSRLKNRMIEIGSSVHELEQKFQIPYYMSKDQFVYLTCFPESDECPTGYPNSITFKLENQKIQFIRFTLYLD